MCTWKECVFCFFGCNVLNISIKSNCLTISFRISVALVIFCPEDLSIDVSGVLKSPTIVFPSISPFMSVSICFMYRGCYIRCISYIRYIYVDKYKIIFVYWLFYHYVVSFFIFLYNLCFKVYFVWYEYCNSCFLVISVCMKYLLPSPLFQSMCILSPKVSLL